MAKFFQSPAKFLKRGLPIFGVPEPDEAAGHSSVHTLPPRWDRLQFGEAVGSRGRETIPQTSPDPRLRADVDEGHPTRRAYGVASS
jgi:hypothetical protein